MIWLKRYLGGHYERALYVKWANSPIIDPSWLSLCKQARSHFKKKYVDMAFLLITENICIDTSVLHEMYTKYKMSLTISKSFLKIILVTVFNISYNLILYLNRRQIIEIAVVNYT